MKIIQRMEGMEEEEESVSKREREQEMRIREMRNSRNSDGLTFL